MLRGDIKDLFPSMSECAAWIGREDLAIMENDHAYIGISEYCGLMAIWLLPKDDLNGNHSNIAHYWCDQIKDKFLKNFGTLQKLRIMSNGEAVFKRKG